MNRLQLCVVLAASLATCEMQGQSFSVAGSLGLPIGDLGEASDIGFGVAIRGEQRLSTPGWYVRGDFSWDRFGGKRGVNNYQYLTFGTSLVHETNRRLYQFAGVGMYQTKTVVDSSDRRSSSDFGLHAGVGYNFNTSLKTFVEFGIVDVFTSGRSSVWFPVRFGVRL